MGWDGAYGVRDERKEGGLQGKKGGGGEGRGRRMEGGGMRKGPGGGQHAEPHT